MKFSGSILRWLSVDGSRYPQVDTSGVRSGFEALSVSLDGVLDESPEKTAALRKLLEAKDCAVRAFIEQNIEADEGDATG